MLLALAEVSSYAQIAIEIQCAGYIAHLRSLLRPGSLSSLLPDEKQPIDIDVKSELRAADISTELPSCRKACAACSGHMPHSNARDGFIPQILPSGISARSSPSVHPGRITMSIPSGCLPFARVLGADWHVIREAHDVPIPCLLLKVV
jgi:hypothetical protein